MNRVQFIPTATVVTALLMGVAAGAAPIGVYTFPGADPGGDAAVPVVTNVTFTPFNPVNVNPVSVSDLYRLESWTTTIAQNTAEYAQFTVTPAPGFRLNVTSLSFDVVRSVDKASPGQKDGPLFGQVRVFQGVGLTLVGSQNFSPVGVWQTVTLNLGSLTTANGEGLTVRFYGWASGHQNGWMSFDNVALNGAVESLPEPSPFALLSCGLMVFLSRWAVRRH